MTLDTRLLNAIRERRLIPPATVLIVAVSGGADSLALLHLLTSLQARLKVRLHAATLDHGLRGQAGADDARYVADLCEQWGIPCTVGAANVPELMKAERLGVEAAARRARYGFLASVAREQGAERVAVAHHLGDQAETVLMHLLRGAGVTGLKGMAYAAPMPYHPTLTLVRPLLNVTRREIEAYLDEHGLTARHDATNDGRDTTRNRIRHDVLPVLRAINPRIDRVLAQLAETASVEDDFIEAELQRILTDVIFAPDHVKIPKRLFASLHLALQRRLIRRAVAHVDAASEPDYTHVTRAVDIATRGHVGATALLPRGLHLRVDYDALIVKRREVEIQSPVLKIAPDVEIAVTVPGTTHINDWLLHAALTPSGQDAARLSVPADAQLTLRARRPGDRFAPLGMAGRTRKIGAWMIDNKVPRGVRDSVPLLLVDDVVAAILWGDQWALAERFAVTNHSDRTVYFRVKTKLMKNFPIT